MIFQLIKAPEPQHLSRLYFELSKLGVRSIGKKYSWPYKIKDQYDLMLYASLMSRYDPRLFGILVEYFYHHWAQWNPYQLRKSICQSTESAIWGVIGEFVKEYNQDPEAIYFFNYIQQGLQSVQPQFFFKDLYPSGGHLAQLARNESIREFSRWGFWARERPLINYDKRVSVGVWDKKERQHILKRLLKTYKEISISTYLHEVKNTISRQQALKDLNSLVDIRQSGGGRKSIWSDVE